MKANAARRHLGVSRLDLPPSQPPGFSPNLTLRMIHRPPVAVDVSQRLEFGHFLLNSLAEANPQGW